MDSPSGNRLRSVVLAGEVKRSHSHKSKKRSRVDDGVSREYFRELRSNVDGWPMGHRTFIIRIPI